jgi:zinc D-Ala-D-Ala carboxypeptidase
MKHKKTHVLALFIALSALISLAVLAARPGHGQSPSKQSVSETQKTQEGSDASTSLQPTAAVRERRATTPVSKEESAALFSEAASRNAQLKYELEWQIGVGGNMRRGWYLYAPLISHLINTDKDAATSDFASALARWQRGVGLQADGVLDDKTISRMVAAWQDARLQEKPVAQPEQLLLVPTSDFYDTTRRDDLRQVERETYAAYKRLVAAAIADKSLGLKYTKAGELAPEEKFLKIVSSFRSPEYQSSLPASKAGRTGLAKVSAHFTGRALDLYVGGDPVNTNDSNRAIQVQTPVYLWLVRNADKFGFRPYYFEPWHWEYVGKEVGSKQ